MPIAFQLVVTLFYVSASVAAGGEAIFAFKRGKGLSSGLNTTEFMAGSFLLGLGLFAIGWLLLGLVGWFKSWLIWCFCASFLLLGLWRVLNSRELIEARIVKSVVSIRGVGPIWLGLLGFFLILFYYHGLASLIRPPYGDAEAFYMVLPKIMASSGRLSPQPNYYELSQIGLFGELHYAALMAIGGPAAAKLISWFVAMAGLAILAAICSRVGLGYRGKIIALIMVLTSSAFTNYISDGKVDLFGAALGLAAFFWMLESGAALESEPVFLSGVFAGWACVAKFSNIPVVVPGLVLMLLWNGLFDSQDEARRPGQQIASRKRILLRAAAIFFSGLFIAFIPHLAKNSLLFGEPFAPFIFFGHGERWVDQVWFTLETTRFLLLTYPFALIFGQYPMQDGCLSVLLAAFLPIAFILRPKGGRRNPLVKVSVIALICLLIWMAVRPSVIAPRYILATLLLFFPLPAWAAEKFFTSEKGSTPVRLVMIFSLLITMFISWYPLRGYQSQMASAFESSSTQPNTYRSARYYPAMDYLNRMAEPGERVYFFGYYSFLMDSHLLQCMNHDPIEQVYYKIADSTRRWEYLFERGFNYVLIQKATHSHIIGGLETEGAPEWLSVTKPYEDETTVIYRLRSLDPERVPDVSCHLIQGSEYVIIEQNLIP